MSQSFQVEALRAAILGGQIEWQRHCLQRMFERNVSRQDVIQTVLHGERIEDYPTDRPLPSALFLGQIDIRPLHVVVAFDAVNIMAFVITVYEPDVEHFEPGFKIRRKL